MKIMILVGSADANSHSLHLGRAISNELQLVHQDVEIINLIEYGLPLYDRAVERNNTFDEKTRVFLDKSLSVDAFVWVTPIYHNSYSSLLKNALDWHHSTKFPGRVVGLASNGGNRSPQAADQLTLIARSQHMIVTPTRVCTDADDYDQALAITSDGIHERIKKFSAELVDLAEKLRAA
jgi:azobenzene reductase